MYDMAHDLTSCMNRVDLIFARQYITCKPTKAHAHKDGAGHALIMEACPENKQKKQDEFEALVHANRFQPTKAMDEDEAAFLNEKAAERRAAELARKEQDKIAETEYRLALARQSDAKHEQVDLAKLMGQVTHTFIYIYILIYIQYVSVFT